MTKAAYLAAATLCAGVFVLMLTGSDTAVAQGGCCMERDGPNAPWHIVGRDLQDCKKRNADADKEDNIMRPQGRIWWNINC